jgi:mraZ protein
MLIGKSDHNIDEKGRLFIPSKYREDLGDKFVITKGLDCCLNLYSLSEWKLFEEKILALPRSKSKGLQQYFFNSAESIKIDSQGRFVIPADLKKFADLKKSVKITGSSNHLEIWDIESWEEENNKWGPENISALMEELGI